LERGGITRDAYESGASLKAARGHSATPEKPTDYNRNPDQFPEYGFRKQGGTAEPSNHRELVIKVAAREHSLFHRNSGGGPTQEQRMETLLRLDDERVDDDTLRDMLHASDSEWRENARRDSNRMWANAKATGKKHGFFSPWFYK
jgi:hypothetical protein